MKSQITKPNPFNIHTGYVDLPGLDLWLSNNKSLVIVDSGGTQRAVITIDAANSCIVGDVGINGNLQIRPHASKDIVVYDGSTRLQIDPLDNLKIAGVGATGMYKGIGFPKGVNPTGNPADGFSINADATNGFPYVRDENGNKGRLSLIKTGTYTGDGTVSQAITGIGFLPQKVEILVTATGEIITTTSDLVPTALKTGTGGVGNAIISLDADGFTVDDGGADSHPNANATLYYYTVWG